MRGESALSDDFVLYLRESRFCLSNFCMRLVYEIALVTTLYEAGSWAGSYVSSYVVARGTRLALAYCNASRISSYEAPVNDSCTSLHESSRIPSPKAEPNSPPTGAERTQDAQASHATRKRESSRLQALHG